MFAHARRLLAALTVVCLLFCAPGYGTVERAGKVDPAVQTRFTATDARQALIEMVQGDDRLRFMLAELKAGGGMVLMDEQTEGVAEGVWNCNLARKTFGFIARARLGCQYSCDGVFERGRGKWVARITGQAWSCERFIRQE